MNRCFSLRARIALFVFVTVSAAAASLLPASAAAQGIQRDAPKDVVLGVMTVMTPPEITIDGKADRLSPGSRIRDLNNMVVMSGILAGKTMPVVYRREAVGLVHEVWILTPEEYRRLGGAASGLGFTVMLQSIFGERR